MTDRQQAEHDPVEQLQRENEELRRRLERLEVFVQALRGAAGAVIDE